MKAGIFVDAENVMRNGGWGMRYDVLKDIVIKDQGCTLVRANVYMAIDRRREDEDEVYWQKKEDYRSQVRRCGFKIVFKEVRRYVNEDGEIVMKANTDMDLAVDVLLQARNLDYIVLLSGDGDFVRLVNALQNAGTRVDVISFHNTSRALREAADYHCYGFLIPGLIPTEGDRKRGTLYTVDEARYFGHIATLSSFQTFDKNVFCHGSEIKEDRLSNKEFALLKDRQAILEFDVFQSDRGPQARNVTILKPPQVLEAERRLEPPLPEIRPLERPYVADSSS
jgi:uncharacterized LabA/DUF88 family protein/cold shock CspA family protein